MLADIAGADRAQQCIGDGVRQDVCVGMSFQSARVRNLDAAKDQFPSFSKAMYVVTNSASNSWTMSNDPMSNTKNMEASLVRQRSPTRSSINYVYYSFVIAFSQSTAVDATMLYLSFMSSRGRRSTVPPAFSTSSQPAAMSHRLIPCSM